MNEKEIRELVLITLHQIAPEADLGGLDSERRFRDQFEFDSVDFLNFALALQDRVKVLIPEEDYPALGTMDGCVAYLLSKGFCVIPNPSSD